MRVVKVGIAGLLVISGILASGALAAVPTKLVDSGNSTCRDIALTYDVEFASTTQALADTLDELNVRSTWFFVGREVQFYPNLVRQVASRHQIGNHSYDHPLMTALTDGAKAQQIRSTHQAIERAAGVAPAPLFRPPYGSWDSKTLETLSTEGYRYVVMWTVDTRDWERPTAQTIRERIVGGAFPGAVVLQHGHVPQTVEATRMAITDLKQMGYQFVTITEILGDDRQARDFGGDTYIVQGGDTWDWVASCHNLSTQRLVAYNEGLDLTPGQTLRIPYRNEVIVRVNGERRDFRVTPKLVDGRTVAHIRLAEELDANVYWLNGQAAIIQGEKVILVRPGSQRATVNGREIDMGTAAYIEQDVVMVPIRFLAEQLGASILWDAQRFTVDLRR